MLKLIVGILILAGLGYLAYDSFRAGFHARPKMSDGAFSISYKNGMRAILVGVPNEQDTRRYFGFPAKVPHYLEDAWSFCTPSNEEYAADFLTNRGNNPDERFEAICQIQVDDDEVIRGFITSVPKL